MALVDLKSDLSKIRNDTTIGGRHDDHAGDASQNLNRMPTPGYPTDYDSQLGGIHGGIYQFGLPPHQHDHTLLDYDNRPVLGYGNPFVLDFVGGAGRDGIEKSRHYNISDDYYSRQPWPPSKFEFAITKKTPPGIVNYFLDTHAVGFTPHLFHRAPSQFVGIDDGKYTNTGGLGFKDNPKDVRFSKLKGRHWGEGRKNYKFSVFGAADIRGGTVSKTKYSDLDNLSMDIKGSKYPYDPIGEYISGTNFGLLRNELKNNWNQKKSKLDEMYDELKIEDIRSASGKATSLWFSEPHIYIRPPGSKNNDGKILTGINSRLLPVDSTLLDIFRMGKAVLSPRGLLFGIKQFALQVFNPRLETMIWNPLSLASIVPMVHINRHWGTDYEKAIAMEFDTLTEIKNAVEYIAEDWKPNVSRVERAARRKLKDTLTSEETDREKRFKKLKDLLPDTRSEDSKPGVSKADMEARQDLISTLSSEETDREKRFEKLKQPLLEKFEKTRGNKTEYLDFKKKYYSSDSDSINASKIYTITREKSIENALPYNPDDSNDASKEATEVEKASSQLVKFKIHDAVSGKMLLFRAMINGISESVNPQWSSYRYLGAKHQTHVYLGADRTLSFSFTLYPQSIKHMEPMWEKLKALSQLSFGDPMGGDKMIAGVVSLTIGDMYKDALGIVEGVTITADDGSTWEIQPGTQLPKHISVNISFRFMGDSADRGYDYDFTEFNTAIDSKFAAHKRQYPDERRIVTDEI